MVLFFLTSRKNAGGPKGQAFEASHEEAQVSSGHTKASQEEAQVSSGHTKAAWQSPYEIIGGGCDAGGFRYQPSQRSCSSIYVCIDIYIYIHR